MVAMQQRTADAMLKVTAEQVRIATLAALEIRAGQIKAALHVLCRLLAVRFLLLLAWGGGVACALIALQSGTYQAVAVLVGYAVLVLFPLVWLERNKGE